MMTSPQGAAAAAPSAAKDTLGCPFGSLHDDKTFTGADIKFYRKRTDDTQLGQVETPATNRGFLVGVSTRKGHSRRIFQPHHSSSHDFGESSIYIRNFADAYRADLSGAFDFMLMEISPACLEQIANDAGNQKIHYLKGLAGHKDAVLANLMKALVPAFERPQEASALFVDQVAIAMGTYIVHQYGEAGGTPPQKVRTLSRAHEALAKELIMREMKGDVSVAEVAAACNLSRSYFIRAFRETTGQTPHQWLMRQRVERARDLLLNSQYSLSEIAGACGFADQSHFTRVFAANIGLSPGIWRRKAI